MPVKRIVLASVVLVVAAALVLASCFRVEDHLGSTVPSPSGQYGVFATVNLTDPDAADYRGVIVHLLDAEGRELASIDTNASNVHKWALGWMPDADIVVLMSADIGTRVYRVLGTGWEEVARTAAIEARACELYEARYERVSSQCR
jgi:hypothetical protein